MSKIKADLHVHTNYSPDSRLSIDALLIEAVKKDISAVAITDHGAIKGAIELRNRADGKLKVIVGEEVWTKDGELIGLFLDKEIPNFMTALETAKFIKEQGGLVMAPHPFGRRIPSKIAEKTLHE